MRIRALTICLVLLSHFALADYLVVNRKTSVKVEPSSLSARKVQVEDGTVLALLDDGVQVNGYYHVTGNAFEGDGWIYRTFVRRYTGEAPGLVEMLTAGKVEVRVVDVGPGLCTLIKLPDGKYIIYDTGHKQWTGDLPGSQISQVIEEGSVIELMVLSHNHTDHMGGAHKVLSKYVVKKVLWPGYHEPPVTEQGSRSMNQRFLKALADAPYPIEKVNLFEADSLIQPGTKLQFGEVEVVFLCGFGKPPESWAEDLKGSGMKGERINSVSIVMKLSYRGNSILFCGDAVGRDRSGDEEQLIATESFLVQYAKDYLKSTIVISPHHGADNGNSRAFVDLVKPEAVIFSAGHEYNHPTKSAAERYEKYVLPNLFFRTDRGDDERMEGKPDYEWDAGRVAGCVDGIGDDDIQIELNADGTYTVAYVNALDPCSVEVTVNE